MGTVDWHSLPTSLRVAAAAFAAHALLLVLDLAFFASAYAGISQNEHFWPLARIVAFCLASWSLLQRTSKPWLIGAIAFTAFLIHDVMRLSDIFAGPPLDGPHRLLTSALFMSLAAGIGASVWASAAPLLSKPAA
jgi:hypothetical protein